VAFKGRRRRKRGRREKGHRPRQPCRWGTIPVRVKDNIISDRDESLEHGEQKKLPGTKKTERNPGSEPEFFRRGTMAKRMP